MAGEVISISSRIKNLKKHLVRINQAMYPAEYDESKDMVVSAIHDRVSWLKKERKKLVLVKDNDVPLT